MFFVAAKLIWFVIQPSTALILLLVAGIVAIGLGRPLAGMLIVMLGTTGLLVAGLLPLGVLMMLPLEDRFQRQEPDGPVAGIIVLGGGIDQSIGAARGVTTLTEAGERLTEAVALARRYPEARLVFTGGIASLTPEGPTESDAARRFFAEMGIPADRLTVEDQSRDTAENARFTKALVDPKPGERWLLVTSAWHMPRSVGCFRAIGWPVVAWPTDYRSAGPQDLTSLMPRASYGLTMVDVAAKEWVGLLAYRLTGRTDALFPAP